MQSLKKCFLFLTVLLWAMALGWNPALVKDAQASPPKALSMRTDPTDAGVALGETYYLPVVINLAPKWKSLEIRFEFDEPNVWSAGNPADIHVGTVKLDATQWAIPQTVQIPIRVTGEGKFTLKGVARIEMPEGETIFDRKSFDYPLDAGVFAFEGKVFVAWSVDSAMSRMARSNLKEQSARYRELLKNGTKQDAKKLEDQEFERIYRSFWESSPYQKKSRKVKALPPNIKQGDPITLQVNWATENTFSSFLPLHGARIQLTDNANGNTLPEGELVNGQYTFTAPRDDYSFTAAVSTRYRDAFSVLNARKDDDLVTIRFRDQDIFNIKLDDTSPDHLLKISNEEARAFSVFQALGSCMRVLPVTWA